MDKLPITAIVPCRNEAANIVACLASLSPAARVVVVDSASSDATPVLAREAGAEVIDFSYEGGYPKKRQWVLDHLPLATPWVLLVDADERIPQALWDEIRENLANPSVPQAFLIVKGFHFLGRRFRFGGFSHAAVLLFRRGSARFEHILDEPASAPDMEIHERLVVQGDIGVLKAPLIHQDFKGLQAYLERHNHYSTWEAAVRHRFLTTGRWGEETISPRLFGNTQERRRFLKAIAVRIPLEPLWWFLYHYVARLGFLEGRAGLIASLIRAGYIFQVRAKLYELGRPRS
ncbi:MAG: glycosyltransferase family 2 protein [Magnetococcales bacterium]|nr:glycosyltransferase family 2 protein [Magnetococcales bacterium]